MKKGIITTSLWDASEHLESDEDMVMYLEAALEDGDPALISAVLGDIARAKGIAQIAEKTGGYPADHKLLKKPAVRLVTFSSVDDDFVIHSIQGA